MGSQQKTAGTEASPVVDIHMRGATSQYYWPVLLGGKTRREAIPSPPPNTPDSFVSYPAITTSGQGTFVSLGSRRKRALKKLNLFPPASLNSAIASKKRRAPRSACPRRKSSYICIYTHSVCRAVIVVRRSCCPRFNKPRSIGSSTMTEGRGQANAPAMAGDDVDQLLGQIVQEQMAHMPQVGS